MTSEQQEIFHLKKQLAWYQVEMSLLESKLNQCQLENKQLEAENAVLIEERTDQQMPVDAHHAKLVRENARLQVVSNVMRKSFKKSSQDARRKSECDQQTINILEKENKILRRRKSHQEEKDQWQTLKDFRFSDNNLQEEFGSSSNNVTRLARKSRRDTILSKSNGNTAPTCPLDESRRSFYSRSLSTSLREEIILRSPIQHLVTQSTSIIQKDNNNNNKPVPIMKCDVDFEEATKTEDCGTKQGIIDAEELKQAIPWLQWAVKGGVKKTRADYRCYDNI